MQRYDFGIKPIIIPGINDSKPKKKRQLTNTQKLWCWENNPHVCNICGKRVSKQSDAEFDHTRSYSKKGATNLSNVKITHRLCNRMKGSKSLSETQRFLGIKPKKRRSKTTAKKKKRQVRKPSDSIIPGYMIPVYKMQYLNRQKPKW